MRHFCCRSQEWTLVPEDDRKKLGLVFSNDGEFWSVLICHVFTLLVVFICYVTYYFWLLLYITVCIPF